MFGRYHITTKREPKQLRSTQSYIYYTDDKKGEGATGNVFGGREKKSGERVAVKVFNNESYRRPGSVQHREFDVLLKLKHPNIVKLLAIEEDSSSHDRVIIMELCEGGSLFNVLDKPENSFGLAETEFKILLRDVSQGMKHLQDKGIVHRDLKPGNIMCCYEPDGCSVYKLADFGAARELAEGENFVSIYGTEEYLHPDVYERAVLRKPLVRPFTASVDLWSIGVTLYHAATGVLPFRPYGGRRNRSTMHQMTTLKASGIISGVQRKSENAPIDWSRELPKTTQLSQGLRFHVEEMLAGLLESDVTRIWSFKTFFDTCQAIVNMTVLDVFYTVTSQLLKIYIDPTHSFAEFQESIAIQTSLQSVHQVYIFEDAVFYPESNVPCRDFPETTPANPIFLFKSTFGGSVSPVAPVIPTVPDVPSRYSLSTDAPATKRSIAALFCLKRKQELLLLIQILLNAAVKAFTHVIKDEVKHLQYYLNKLETQNKTLPSELESMRSRVQSILTFWGAIHQNIASAKKTELAKKINAFVIVGDEVALQIGNTRQLSLRLEQEAPKLRSLHRQIVDQDVLTKEWNKQLQCHPRDKCVDRFDVMLLAQLEIYSNFCRDSKETSLTFNAEQIHKMEKIRFNDMLHKMISLVHDHCETNWLEKHSETMKWFGTAYSFRQRIAEVDQFLTPLVSDFAAKELAITKLGERCREESDIIESDISELRAATSFHLKAPFQDDIAPLVSPSASTQTSVVQQGEPKQSREANNQTPWSVYVVIGPREGGSLASGEDHVHPLADSGIADLQVPILRDFKLELQNWQIRRPETQAIVKKCQNLTKDMQNELLDLSDPSLDLYGYSM
ncbi:serine/threonine-protein kinase TBK1-like [Patiria miniata]|uniref:IkappaB kinase n=1 Tax=Patiria miniata TaxID=46514 RepID=A0A913ZSR3_PATMI|nr:serine/threonine-protein kinase TBK1-like [Patiria miniata]XP_038054122.1 serine/threonine-protein kinase TBK1-like [Patiria miniata]